MIHIYNTLTRSKEEFRPAEKGRVRMYVCGPTVYDVPHIGHARSALCFDVIRRYFQHSGMDVFFVRNVTDVDDKIIARALRELEDLGETHRPARLRERVNEVASKYLEIYRREMEVLGVLPPTREPRATEAIEDMISFISVLVEKGTAYVSNGSVYFSVADFPEYGKLSNRDMEEMLHGVRIDPDRNKRHPLDFALWKRSAEGEPSWESPWGEGRPGWHIECSVMSTKILGDEFDIHGGGLDLIFPHHENEIAQAEAATGGKFARYWIHNGLLTVNGEKMSKSLGNYITISDFLEKHGDPDLLKMAFLMSHYRSPMDYSDAKIGEMKSSKDRILNFFDRTERMLREISGDESAPEGLSEDMVAASAGEVEEMRGRFESAMEDDFNTASAMSVLFDAVKAGNDHLREEGASAASRIYMAGGVRNFIMRYAAVAGLSLSPVRVREDEADRIEALVREREEYRRRKDFPKADRVRDRLLEMGVTVEDTPEGPVWRKR